MDIEREIANIRERNTRVESDKAWETSVTRRFSIAAMTYAIAAVWLSVIGESSIWLKAAVPTGGYLLSTLSLPLIKRRWIGMFQGKE